MPPAVARVAAAIFILAAPLAARGSGATESGIVPVEVAAKPIPTFLPGSAETVFGTLEFRGGLVLSSPDRRFGSLSGLDFTADGRLMAVADSGFWFTASLDEKDGRPAAIRNAAIAPLLDDAGRPLRGKLRSDAEGLRLSADGSAAYVTFEGNNSVRRYRASPDFARARGEPVAVPKAVARLPRNEGLEAVALPPPGSALAGAVVLFAEHALDAAGNHRGFIVGGPHPGTFTIRRIGEFDLTDAAFLPDGDLLVLERSFSYSAGVAMRLRRFAAADLRPGAVLEGPIQFEAGMRYDIDNMEGLAVHRNEAGETIVDLISDDNNNRLFQRTLLLRFALKGGPVAPSPVPASPAAEAPPMPRARPVP
jgi:hypothetical protein